jgi:hypothetical protein
VTLFRNHVEKGACLSFIKMLKTHVDEFLQGRVGWASWIGKNTW